MVEESSHEAKGPCEHGSLPSGDGEFGKAIGPSSGGADSLLTPLCLLSSAEVYTSGPHKRSRTVDKAYHAWSSFGGPTYERDSIPQDLAPDHLKQLFQDYRAMPEEF